MLGHGLSTHAVRCGACGGLQLTCRMRVAILHAVGGCGQRSGNSSSVRHSSGLAGALTW